MNKTNVTTEIKSNQAPCEFLSKTQRSEILRLLLDARGSWVPLPEILALGIAQYGARILELRRLGFTIENRTERLSGQRRSWFRLVEPSLPDKLAPAPARNLLESDYMRRVREEQGQAMPLFDGVRQ
jgi:hypothetical protein